MFVPDMTIMYINVFDFTSIFLHFWKSAQNLKLNKKGVGDDVWFCFIFLAFVPFCKRDLEKGWA